MKIFCTNGRGEFILVKLKDIYNKNSILIKYLAPYMYKETGLAKRGWQTIITIKNFLPINDDLLLKF